MHIVEKRSVAIVKPWPCNAREQAQGSHRNDIVLADLGSRRAGDARTPGNGVMTFRRALSESPGESGVSIPCRGGEVFLT
jgi:hypothetical protein